MRLNNVSTIPARLLSSYFWLCDKMTSLLLWNVYQISFTRLTATMTWIWMDGLHVSHIQIILFAQPFKCNYIVKLSAENIAKWQWMHLPFVHIFLENGKNLVCCCQLQFDNNNNNGRTDEWLFAIQWICAEDKKKVLVPRAVRIFSTHRLFSVLPVLFFSFTGDYVLLLLLSLWRNDKQRLH